jgi:hypothetical protein
LARCPKLDPDRLGVLMPHLLIWGMDDEALLPVSWATLPDYCDVHQKTDEVTGLIDDFLRG